LSPDGGDKQLEKVHPASMQPHLLDTPVKDICNVDVLRLLRELEMVAPVSVEAFGTLTLWNFLVQCVYPDGIAGKRVPIDARHLLSDAYLNCPVRILDDNDLFALCEQIAKRSGDSLEFHMGKKLAAFLNAKLPKFATSNKNSSGFSRADRIIAMRRRNQM
jgi:hypothetical protein